MNRRVTRGLLGLAAAMVVGWAMPASAQNLFTDPSFEKPIPRNRFGQVMAEWPGWIFEGASCFEVGQVARTGNTSLEIVGAVGGKIRMYSEEIPLAAGRYRLTLYLRGLDIGQGRWGTNLDLSVDQAKFVSMKRSGTFGWTRREVPVVVGLEAKTLTVIFQFQRMVGTVWVDNVALKACSP
jgi:hypothetical protein